MPKRAYIIPIVLCFLLILIMAAWGGGESVHPAGCICIGAIQAEVYTIHEESCDCCPPLWSGGIVTTDADLSCVQEGDWATITLMDGTRLVMECAAITPCLRVGNWLIGEWGITKAEGEIIIYDKCMAWWLVRL